MTSIDGNLVRPNAKRSRFINKVKQNKTTDFFNLHHQFHLIPPQSDKDLTVKFERSGKVETPTVSWLCGTDECMPHIYY